MTHADWHAAMLAEPADDLARLAFADWLEEAGEGDRAAFVRASVEAGRELDRGGPGDGRNPTLRRERSAWRRAWPVRFRRPGPGVEVRPDRGLVEFAAGSADGVGALAACPWLPDALAAGWVGAVRVEGCRPADLRAWDRARRALPAAVPWGVSCCDDQDDVPAAVRAALECPVLVDVCAPLADVSAGALGELLARPDLRSLLFTLYGCPPGRWSEAAGWLAAAPHLRRLVLWSCGDYDASEVLRVAANPALRRLDLPHCPPDFTPAVDAARAARPDLTVTASWAAP